VFSGIHENHALVKKGVTVDWRGKLYAPEGIIDAEGYVTLPPRPPKAARHRAPLIVDTESTPAEAAEASVPSST
jgi:hypothetical protein